MDVPLDEVGRAQAQVLAGLLGGERFDHAVSSDLSRALETARAICGEQPVALDPRWREFAFGEWEGLTWEQIVGRWPDLREHHWSTAKDYAPKGGESFDAVLARVREAVADLQSGGYENVLVVTHAGPLHAVLHAFFGDRETEMQEVLGVRFMPASVTRIAVARGRADLLALNEIPSLE